MRAAGRGTLVLAVAAALLARPAAAQAHGIGGRSDLPVPLSFFLVGAGVVLVVSFVALALLWPVPRLQGGVIAQRLLTERPPPAAASVLRGLGLLSLLLVLAAGLFGVDNSSRNLAPVMVWVVFWLVLPFAAAALGNLYTWANPWRTIGDWLGLGGEERPDVLQRWGVWPAAAVFLAFTWLELVWPESGSPRTLGVAALVYTAYAMALMAGLGTATGLQVGDAFTTYNRLLSAIAPLGRDAEGRLVRRGWLRALPAIPLWPGLAAFVVLMIGTVTYDGLSATLWWRDLVGGGGSMWAGTAALVGVPVLVGAGYLLACWAAARLAGGGHTTAGVARSFAHTLVPIGLAYAVAHYVTLILFEGQLLLATISDPFGYGWDLFGTAGRRISYWLSPVGVWYVQVAVIVTGHVLGVVLAHDRALAEFPPQRAVKTQYAMLVLMVALTGLGLTILAAG